MNFFLKYFILSRFIFLTFAVVAVLIIPIREGYLGNQLDISLPYLAWIWANFDGRHFINIADKGYTGTNFAYFPLYPSLISFLSKFFPISSIYLGIIISLLAYFVATIYLCRLIREFYNQNIAKLTIILISFFPLAFFYNSVYADSLFLLFTVCCFYFFHKKNWVLAGVFGMLSILTRLSGVALIPALFAELYIINNGKIPNMIKPGVIVLGVTILGLVLYMTYLGIYFGDFLLFQKSMSAWGQEKFVIPLQVFYRYLKIFITADSGLLTYWVAVLEFVSIILYGIMTVYVFVKVRKSYGVFMFFLLLLVPITGTFAGTPRYALHLFPFFLGLALLLENRKYAKFIVLTIFLILGGLLTGLFTRGYFIG